MDKNIINLELAKMKKGNDTIPISENYAEFTERYLSHMKSLDSSVIELNLKIFNGIVNTLDKFILDYKNRRLNNVDAVNSITETKKYKLIMCITLEYSEAIESYATKISELDEKYINRINEL